MFNDITNEIEELFAEQQERYADAIREDIIYGGPGLSETERTQHAFSGRVRANRQQVVQGFRIFHPNPPKTEYRKAQLRRFERGYALERMKERLLAGERPALSAKGAPAKRWLAAAASLGIELPHAPKGLKERILAGERPKLNGRGRPPTRWFKAAAELGIDLHAPPTDPAARV